VASGFFPANSASDVSRVVMGTADRLSVSMAARASVPRLNHGLPTLRRLGAISRRFTFCYYDTTGVTFVKLL
jgi:hypothetical protein